MILQNIVDVLVMRDLFKVPFDHSADVIKRIIFAVFLDGPYFTADPPAGLPAMAKRNCDLSVL